MTDATERPPTRPPVQIDNDPTRMLNHKGRRYGAFLTDVMRMLGTRTYFEIGTRRGMSLAGANCRAVAVDPSFLVETNVIGKKPVTMFFQMTSDRFFEDFNLTHLLGGPAEVCFLDGFHINEYLLRDFINTEKHCKRNSLVFLHDCLPWSYMMTDRRQTGGAIKRGWTGDVWKVVPILQKYRPELKIHALDCPPTGLIMITGLDPASTVLESKFFDIIAEFREADDDIDRLKAFIAGLPIVSTQDIKDNTDLGKYTW